MTRKPIRLKLIIGLLLAVVGLVAAIVFRAPLLELSGRGYHFIADRQRVQQFILSFGAWAPVVFMVTQVLQVIFAPIPGEATGFIGGYLFGTGLGFCLSSIALTIGSWVNFSIGRFLGKHWVRKLIPPAKLAWFDQILKRQGLIVLSALFIFPGFPKDYMCLFLGISTLPLKFLLLLSGLGRMPGTLMLSIQGAFVYERKYWPFALMLVICLAVMGAAWRYREQLYRFVERFNHSN